MGNNYTDPQAVLDAFVRGERNLKAGGYEIVSSAKSLEDFNNGVGFYQYQQPNFDISKNSGWKFHISVDAADVPRANAIINQYFGEQGVSVYKVTSPATTVEFGNPVTAGTQSGKMFTVYDMGENWAEIMPGLEGRLSQAGIRPGLQVQGDRAITGSQYSYYRNDGNVGGKGYSYANASNVPEAQRYNPNGDPDPFQNIDTRRNGIGAFRSPAPGTAPESYAELLDRKLNTPGAIERLQTNRGYSIMIRGDDAEVARLQGEFQRRGIETTIEPKNSEFGSGLRVRSTGVAAAEQELKNAPELAAAARVPTVANESYAELLDRKLNTPGAIERLQTNRGYSIMIRGDDAEVARLQGEFQRRGIETTIEPKNSEFGSGLRVRSTGVAAAEQELKNATGLVAAGLGDIPEKKSGLFGRLFGGQTAPTPPAPPPAPERKPDIFDRLIDAQRPVPRNWPDTSSRDLNASLGTDVPIANRAPLTGDTFDTTAPELRRGTGTVTELRNTSQLKPETAPVDMPGPTGTNLEIRYSGNKLTMGTDSPVRRTGFAANDVIPDVAPKPALTPDIVQPSLEVPVAPLAEGEAVGGRLAATLGRVGKVGGVLGMAAIPGVIGLATRKDGESVGDAIGRGYSDTVKTMVMTPLAAAERGDKLGYAAGIIDISGIPASAILNENRLQTAAANLPQAQVDKFLPTIKGNENLGSKDEQLNHISKLIFERDQGYPNLLMKNNNQILGPTKETKSLGDAIAATGGRENASYTFTTPISEVIDQETRRYMASGGNPETMRETLDPAYARERRFERLRNLVPDNTYSNGPNLETTNGMADLQKFKDGIQAGNDRTPEGKEALMKVADAYYAAYPDAPQDALKFASRSMSRGTTLGATVPNTGQLMAAGFGPLMGLSGKPEDAGTDKARFDTFITKGDLYKRLEPNADYTIDAAAIYSKLPPAQQAQVQTERARLAALPPAEIPAPVATPAPAVAAAAAPEAAPEEIVVTGSRYKKGTADKAIPDSVRKLVDQAGLTSWMDEDGDGKITMREMRDRMEQADAKAGYDKITKDDVNARLPKLQAAAQADRSSGRA